MASEALLEWTMTGLETATGHLNQVFEESLVAGKEKETELLVVSSFFKEFALVEKKYKEGLVKLVLKYQKQVHETLKDEKMMQYFQMMFNNLLVKSDLVEKRQDFFGSFQKKLVALDLNFRNKVQTRIDGIQVEKDMFRRKLDSFRLNFGEYFRMCDSYNKYCVDKIDMYQGNYERLQDFKGVLEDAHGFDQRMKVVSEIIGYKYDIGAKDAKKIKMKFTVKHRKEKLSRAEVDRFNTYFETLKAKYPLYIIFLIGCLKSNYQRF